MISKPLKVHKNPEPRPKIQNIKLEKRGNKILEFMKEKYSIRKIKKPTVNKWVNKYVDSSYHDNFPCIYNHSYSKIPQTQSQERPKLPLRESSSNYTSHLKIDNYEKFENFNNTSIEKSDNSGDLGHFSNKKLKMNNTQGKLTADFKIDLKASNQRVWDR